MLNTPLRVVAAAEERLQALADTMHELEIAGGCSEQLLEAEGFSRHEIITLGPAAWRMAERRMNRQVREDLAPGLSDEQVLAVVEDRCVGLIDVGDIIALLRKAGGSPRQIARLWDRITVKLAATIARLPHPTAAQLRQAVSSS